MLGNFGEGVNMRISDILRLFVIVACSIISLLEARAETKSAPAADFRNFSLSLIGVDAFREGRARVIVRDINGATKVGFIDDKGEVIIFPDFTMALNFGDGLAAACRGVIGENYECGYIDRNGRVAIDFKYAGVWSFNEGLAVVRTKAQEGAGSSGDFLQIIDKQGRVLARLNSPPVNKYGYNYYFSDGLLGLELGFDGSIFVDKQGVTKLKWERGRVEQFSEGLAIFIIDKKYGYIDKRGTIKIKPIYDLAGQFKNGIAWVVRDGKISVINTSGETVLEPKGQLGGYGDGLFALNFGKKGEATWGYINPEGKVIIAPKFLSAAEFSESKAFVEERDEEGTYRKCIDKSGNTIFIIR